MRPSRHSLRLSRSIAALRANGCRPRCNLWCPFHSRATCRSRRCLLCARNHHWRPYMCPHQPSNRVLVYSEPSVRLGPDACAMDSLSCDPHSFLCSGVCSLRSNHDVASYLEFDASIPSIYPEAACQLQLREAEPLAAWRSASASLAAPIGSYFRRKRSSTSAGTVSGVPF